MTTAPLPGHPNRSLANTRGAIPLNEAFERLRWSVFEDISNILVLDEPRTQKPDLLPFEGHPIASEPASEIPLTKIAFTIYELNEFAALETGFNDDEFDEPGFEENRRYQRPEPLVVTRGDGGTVTVADVVQQLSGYFLTHKEDILKAKAYINGDSSDHGADDEATVTTTLGGDRGAPPGTRVFFEGFFGIIEPTMESLPVLLWTEGDGSFPLDDRLRQ
ncbi:uncharacterized protein J4E84_009531 [Alternaria hordeiaustralica]|uniref:uncharacterized protein n=1 Tax=Alternaria hordeiaustralica TaxID=1187925 RepID=UPI0020C524E4|nr:uncharacterized protein J4E84_009531 [Alternaria hordeiaustralica]KAI4676696.1 hypothetical protein J4E84_009531 [Alternaria hordeiaustralica]